MNPSPHGINLHTQRFKKAMGLRTYIRDHFIADIRPYKPRHLNKPEKMLEVTSAWKGLEMIVGDIITQFGLNGPNALNLDRIRLFCGCVFQLFQIGDRGLILLKAISTPITSRNISSRPANA